MKHKCRWRIETQKQVENRNTGRGVKYTKSICTVLKGHKAPEVMYKTLTIVRGRFNDILTISCIVMPRVGVYWCTGVLVYLCTGAPWCTGVLVYWCTMVYWCTGVLVYSRVYYSFSTLYHTPAHRQVS